PGQVQVTVEDSGVGLDPNTMARIFEPFFTTKSGGMGMGLSISRSILQNHGGRLWATPNNGPGGQVSTLLFRSTTEKNKMVESRQSDSVIAVVRIALCTLTVLLWSLPALALDPS